MKNLSKNQLIGIIIGVIIIAAAFFLIGMKVGEHKNAAARGQYGQFGQPGMMGRGGYGSNGMMGGPGGMRRMAGNGAVGTILSKDATSITLSLPAGGSKVILISPTTAVMKSTAGTTADLSIGQDVMVNGTPNADGSIAATSVSIRPARPAGSTGTPAGTPAQ